VNNLFLYKDQTNKKNSHLINSIQILNSRKNHFLGKKNKLKITKNFKNNNKQMEIKSVRMKKQFMMMDNKR
jgi:hypothetical protein